MSDHESPEGTSSRLPATCALATNIIQAAVADGSRIRLDAVRAGEQLYEEIIKSARTQAERILAEAHHEAQRIVADARSKASTAGDRDPNTPGITLETLRVELSNVVRQLRRDTGSVELSADPSASLETHDSPSSAPDLGPVAPPLRDEPWHLNGMSAPDQASRNGKDSWRSAPESNGSRDDCTWEPPEWMSADN